MTKKYVHFLFSLFKKDLKFSKLHLKCWYFLFYPPWAFSKDLGGLTLTGERMWPRRHFDRSNIQAFSHPYDNGVNVKAEKKYCSNV